MADLTAASGARVDWARTIAYIDRNGSEMERARLRGLLGRPRPDAKVIRGLEARQREDGGFPYDFIQGRPSAIDTTATALAWLDDLGLLRSVHAERALVFLLAAQRPDGSWDESPALLRYSPPPRLVPGDPRVRVASTALVGFWLARAWPRDDAVARASAYLRVHQAPTGRLVGFLRATWLAAAFFYTAEGPAAASTARALDALDAVPKDRWLPGALAAALSAFGDSGIGGDVPFVAAGLDRLRALGSPDGSWPSEDGDADHVEVTLSALRTLLRYPDVDAPGDGGADATGAKTPVEGGADE